MPHRPACPALTCDDVRQRAETCGNMRKHAETCGTVTCGNMGLLQASVIQRGGQRRQRLPGNAPPRRLGPSQSPGQAIPHSPSPSPSPYLSPYLSLTLCMQTQSPTLCMHLKHDPIAHPLHAPLKAKPGGRFWNSTNCMPVCLPACLLACLPCSNPSSNPPSLPPSLPPSRPHAL